VDRVFWVECPECHKRYFCEYGIRFEDINLVCPFCKKEFKVDESPWIDDRG